MEINKNLISSLKEREDYYFLKLQYIREEKENILLFLKKKIQFELNNNNSFFDLYYTTISKRISREKVLNLLNYDFEKFIKTVYINNSIILKVAKNTVFQSHMEELKDDEELIKTILMTIYYGMIVFQVKKFNLSLFSEKRLLDVGENVFLKCFIKYNYSIKTKFSTYFFNNLKRELQKEIDNIILETIPEILFKKISENEKELIKNHEVLGTFFKKRKINATTMNELLRAHYARKKIMNYYKEKDLKSYEDLRYKNSTLIELTKEIILQEIPELRKNNNLIKKDIH